MTVKDRVGRKRYIAFRAPEPRRARGELEGALADGWRLTVYQLGVGVVRVPHREAAEARIALEALGLEPVTTSGTILQAKRRVGVV